MAVDNKIVFGGVDSSTYGIYISGEGVFNAPKRDVEMISIPGRNGSFALDRGRFENITVTYPAYTYETTMATFMKNLSDFRNALASKKGYQRLEDTFHTDEYRMAAFVDGIEVKPIKYNTASQFEITFDCKPQRWLTSGETKQTIANSGDTITNPTLFEAGPLLEVEGYGTIDVNGTEIEIADETVGTVTVPGGMKLGSAWVIDFSDIYIAPNDPITMSGVEFYARFYRSNESVTSSTAVSVSGDGTANVSSVGPGQLLIHFDFTDPLTFAYGTDSTKQITCETRATISGQSYTKDIKAYVRYSGKTITLDVSGQGDFGPLKQQNSQYNFTNIVINSSATTFGNPTYIDCDLGEAYADDNGEISSLNSYIALGSKLPTLSPGSNTITFDNTMYNVKVTPRWWKV